MSSSVFNGINLTIIYLFLLNAFAPNYELHFPLMHRSHRLKQRRGDPTKLSHKKKKQFPTVTRCYPHYPTLLPSPWQRQWDALLTEGSFCCTYFSILLTLYLERKDKMHGACFKTSHLVFQIESLTLNRKTKTIYHFHLFLLSICSVLCLVNILTPIPLYLTTYTYLILSLASLPFDTF